jgi:hypothetical protein
MTFSNDFDPRTQSILPFLGELDIPMGNRWWLAFQSSHHGSGRTAVLWLHSVKPIAEMDIGDLLLGNR